MIDISHSMISTIDISQIHLNFLDWNFGDTDWQIFAQAGKAQEFNQNVIGDMSKGWNNFVRTGQIWALIIGAALGYLFRSITSS